MQRQWSAAEEGSDPSAASPYDATVVLERGEHLMSGEGLSARRSITTPPAHEPCNVPSASSLVSATRVHEDAMIDGIIAYRSTVEVDDEVEAEAEPILGLTVGATS